MSVQPLAPGAAAADAITQAQARREEYSKFRALVPIDIDGGRAFNPGDPVPTSHVEGGTRQRQVTKYNPATGGFDALVDQHGAAKLEPESFAPVVDRADVYEVGGKDDPNMDPEQVPLDRPADNASLSKWAAFAVQQGMDPDEAAAVTDKADFVAAYPKG